MSNRPTYCWDANVFLAWLGEEATAPLADIDLVRGEIDKGEANLLVPVIAYSYQIGLINHHRSIRK